ncbi:hypothetical protein H4R18_004719 [Coemansia javaensis]|uniref:GAT domain-containing protein n=1 Tax=Coemansia javaensis TaxID=2761396 RepID=A0A9W8LGN7_9FUNG|nr:hypothetical protein H4R18_004719 [Coemansia javaensis]
MPLFGRRKPRLDAIIAEATANPRAYEKLYAAIPQHPNAAKETFQCVIQSIVVKPNKDAKLRGRLMSHRTGGGGGGGGGGIVRRGSGGDPEIHQSMAYLTVLHGVVWSFPYTMNVLFTDDETCMLVLKFILSTVIPLTVRETMLSMVSNWCILYQKSLRARINLEGIVDTVKEKINLRPVARLLPSPPHVQEQKGWHYPGPLPPTPQASLHSHGSTPVLPARPDPFLLQPQAPRQQQSYHGPRPPPLSATLTDLDPVFLSQQQELINSFNNHHHHHHRSPGSHVQWQRPLSARSADGAANLITPEFMAHMEDSARELVSLCGMLTETLVSLNVSEDPGENSVVADMMSDIKRRKEAQINFVGMLGSDHIDTLAKLTEATDRVDRCLWLYDKTLNSHNEWKAIQESLETSAARREIQVGGDVTAPGQSAYAPLHFFPDGQAGPSRSTTRLQAGSSSSAIASTSKAHHAAAAAAAAAAAGSANSSNNNNSNKDSSNDSNNNNGSGDLSLLQRANGSSSSSSHSGAMRPLPPAPSLMSALAPGMSSKARGKMVDTSAADSPEQEYFSADSAYGERPGR